MPESGARSVLSVLFRYSIQSPQCYHSSTGTYWRSLPVCSARKCSLSLSYIYISWYIYIYIYIAAWSRHSHPPIEGDRGHHTTRRSPQNPLQNFCSVCQQLSGVVSAGGWGPETDDREEPRGGGGGRGGGDSCCLDGGSWRGEGCVCRVGRKHRHAQDREAAAGGNPRTRWSVTAKTDRRLCQLSRQPARQWTSLGGTAKTDTETPQTPSTGFYILPWRKVPESDARSVRPLLTRDASELVSGGVSRWAPLLLRARIVAENSRTLVIPTLTAYFFF